MNPIISRIVSAVLILSTARTVFVFLSIVGLSTPLFGQNRAQESTFTNPLLTAGADPWVLFKDGYYYYTNTTGRNLTLWRTKDFTSLTNAEKKVVWSPPASGPNSKDIWAPELHRLNGKWYLYYTATDREKPGDLNRYVFVLENEASNPLAGSWTDKGKLNTNYTGLDGSVFEHQGKTYFLYSGYVGPQSNLFIAEMINPWTISTKQVELARPTLSWEKYDGREICEGPQFLKGKRGKLFIIYSASACWDDNYSLGMLTAAETSNLLDPASWTKSDQPVFAQSAAHNVFGPGHNCFTQSSDGQEDWIVYHAKTEANKACKDRTPRAQRFGWKADGSPDFGIPAAVGTPLQKPTSVAR
ncbi:glycoside hydrolase family 43 protein [Larkinella rosea]|uniref:Alpha-N-arabinofuranosidase n=1 Tax=Larkinella rosea TaxID=2025312 RepID=A0A3P1BP84_9BACT|nr:glycoside hydrolase family 43 protein [Larkinella rosea]RRB02872.1 alpha-N-arabinofuranosidase [Larkinella rosea]